MLRIDAHSHIIPDKLPRFADKFGYDGFIHLEHHRQGYAKMMIGNKFFREIEENCWSAERRFADMERTQIDIQVVCTIPVMFNYWAKPNDALQTSQFLNDHIADVVARYPKRFIGLATVPMQDPQLAIQELERCMKDLKLAGVQIGSHINDWNLSAPELSPFFEACESMGAAVFVHPWDMMGSSSMQRYWLPWLVGMPAETSRAICSMIFGGVFERLPNLRVMFSHGGGAFAGTLGRIMHGFNARPDLVAIDNPYPPTKYLGQFWVDTLVFDADMMLQNLKLFGADKIALGSDYPFPLGELNTGALVESMNLDKTTLQKIYYQSALSWLNLKEEDFI
ncbi:MAG TPA: amidohydrolase family protein [Chitinophagales bacterium]|nr:amidohydrolase family protein [Chitinophagales bacterium]